MSRLTLRDALRILEARGLIRVKVGAAGGIFVADGNTDHVAGSLSTMLRLKRMTLPEIAEARKIVEAATAELAAQRADARAVSAIWRSVEDARPLLGDPITHADASMDFHVELARAAGNAVLYATVVAYRELLIPSIRDLRAQGSSGSATQRAHEEILDAVRSGDPGAAREIMLAHLADFERRLGRRLAERGDQLATRGSAAPSSLARSRHPT